MSFSFLYKQNRIFFSGLILFFIASAFILIFYTKADGFYLFNPYHSYIGDLFFTYFTYLGDGFFCVAIALLLFIFKKRFLSIMLFLSYAISGIIAQVLKYFVLEARPAVLLKDSSYRYFIENVTLHNLHAFPSGHTASAFALAAIFSFYIKNKWYSILFLLYAAAVGYSRIYLAQHFLDDVFAGALIGVVTSVFCWLFFKDKVGGIFYKKLISGRR